MSGITHEQMSDRMPEVARERATWDPSEEAHLAACAECRAEWKLVRLASRVGQRIEGTFDTAATTQAVSVRLRAVRPFHRRPAARALVGLAAAAAIALMLYRPAGPAPAPVGPIPADARLLPELDSLSADELTVIADGLETPLSETPLGSPSALDDLDTTQLTRVLRALEG